MHNETLASEIIKDMLNEKSTILMELECLDVDFDKAAFVLTGVQETMESLQEPKTLDDGLVQYSNIQSSLVYLSVVFDYIKHIQTAIYDMIVRERKKTRKFESKGRKKMDYKKMILDLLEKVQSEYTLKRVYRLLEYLYIRG